jgi:hypothetical protein
MNTIYAQQMRLFVVSTLLVPTAACKLHRIDGKADMRQRRDHWVSQSKMLRVKQNSLKFNSTLIHTVLLYDSIRNLVSFTIISKEAKLNN